MQPSVEQHPSGPAAGWPPPGTGSRAPEPYGPPVAQVRAARPWWVAFSAFLMLLVLIAGLGNQWVSEAITRHIQRQRQFEEYAVRSDLTYTWRFTPSGSGSIADRLWGAHLALIGTALVLTFLLVAVLARGSGGFWQSLVAAWVAVVTSTLVGLYVFAAVFNTDAFADQFGGRAQSIFFAGYPGAALFAALGYGLVVGLVAGLVAVIARRTELVPARPLGPQQHPGGGFAPPGGPPPWGTPPPGGPPPGGPQPGGPPPWGAPPPWSGGSGSGRDQPTTSYEPVAQPMRDQPMPDQPMGGQPTTELPRADGDGGQQTTALPRAEGDDGQQTSELPRADGDDGQQTSELPRAEGDGGQQTSELPRADGDDGQQTTELPRPDGDDGQQTTELPRPDGDDEPRSTEPPPSESGERPQQQGE